MWFPCISNSAIILDRCDMIHGVILVSTHCHIKVVLAHELPVTLGTRLIFSSVQNLFLAHKLLLQHYLLHLLLLLNRLWVFILIDYIVRVCYVSVWIDTLNCYWHSASVFVIYFIVSCATSVVLRWFISGDHLWLQFQKVSWLRCWRHDLY